MIGYSEMLQEEAEDLGETAFLPDLQRINAAGKHLLGLINDILDLSKIEAGRMDLFLETFEIAGLVQDVASIVQPLVEKNGNTLVVSCPDDLGTMHADQTKVRQTLFNLLSNAAKFTEQGHRVASREGDGGAGIRPLSRARGRVGGGGTHLRGLGHRHRDDRGADRAALRGVLPGRPLDQPPVRRDRPRAGDQPPLLPDDGRRHHRRERAGRRLDVHRHPARRSGEGRGARDEW